MPTTYTAIDLETTGLDPELEAIIEIAAVTFREGQVMGEWSSLVNPYREVSPFITRLTGITQRMVDEAPDIFNLRPEIKRRLGNHVLVGHNVGFDLAFLNSQNLALGSHRIDTLTLATILLPGAGRYSLSALAKNLGLLDGGEHQNHRALGDARLTAALFLTLREWARELDFDTLEEIVQSGSSLGWPETLFFEEALRAAARDAFGQTGRGPGRLKRLFKPEKLTGRPLVPADEPAPIDLPLVSGMLKRDGHFSRLFPNFEYRRQQVDMLRAVAEAFNDGQHLIVEAGTGTGKSIGYLLPAAFWASQNGRRVVVSTNTINLQDQLLNKDLPQLAQLLPFELRAAVLKGKRNYVCTRLLQQMRHSGPGNADEMAVYARLLIWLPASADGDIGSLSLRSPGERMAWSKLSADNDACTAEKCAQEGCPLHYARRRAEQAHILVVNHALLLADVASENRVLPEYLDLIIDEAHHLESAVTEGLSFRADRRFLETLLEEITKPRTGLVADMQRRLAAALPQEAVLLFDDESLRLREQGQLALVRLDELFMTLDYFLKQFTSRRSQYAEAIRVTPALRAQPDYDEVVMAWDNFSQLLRPVAEGLVRLAGGVDDAAQSFDIEDADDLRLALLSLARGLEHARLNLDALFADPAESMIYWADVFKGRISLNAAPLHIGPLVEKHIFNTKETVILTSATLRTADPSVPDRPSFDYLRERLHAYHAVELAVGSPFDYEASTLVYLPTDIPEPNQPGYQRYVEAAVVEVARALKGRTMALFTSYGQLADTLKAIERPLAEAGITVLAQTEGSSRQQLLDEFKTDDSPAVLLGTRSFWEGVDVPGEALQAVIIVKFPFDVPTDPIFAARSETFESPFFQYAIPEAVLRFRQGFGRLIRRQDDEGVVIVLDKRILSKRYGQSFISALPPCTILRQRIGRVGELTIRWLTRERE